MGNSHNLRPALFSLAHALIAKSGTSLQSTRVIADAVRRVAERRPHAGLHAEDALRPRPPDGADRSGRPRAARVEGQLGQVRSFAADFPVLLLLLLVPRLLLSERELKLPNTELK